MWYCRRSQGSVQAGDATLGELHLCFVRRESSGRLQLYSLHRTTVRVGLTFRNFLPRCTHNPALESLLSHRRRSRRPGQGGSTCPPPQKKKIGKNYISGKYHVKFGHFVNFSCIYFGQKCLAPLPKLTELLHLCHLATKSSRRNSPLYINHRYSPLAAVSTRPPDGANYCLGTSILCPARR